MTDAATATPRAAEELRPRSHRRASGRAASSGTSASSQADVERERDEYLELARRTKADFENYRKRVAGEAARGREARPRATSPRELLPVLDNLERALAAAEPRDEVAGEPPRRGRAARLRGAQSRAASAGVESYEPAGEQFDPDWHEAMMTRPARARSAGKVARGAREGLPARRTGAAPRARRGRRRRSRRDG